jgi:hypothetical protein
MESCPRCATDVIGPAVKCRACGALLVAPPTPAGVPAGNPAHSRGGLPHADSSFTPAGTSPSAAPAPTADDRFFAPVSFTPVTVTSVPGQADARRRPLLLGAIVISVLAFATGGYALTRSRSGSGSGSSAVVLPATAESSGGLPGLSEALRVQAEASRQRATVVINQALAESSGGAVDTTTLQRLDPSLDWVTANESSSGPTVVSFSQSGDSFVVAVSNKGHDICAFGRAAPPAVGEYVTLGKVSSCRAADAPADGWTQLSPAGGSRYVPPEDAG